MSSFQRVKDQQGLQQGDKLDTIKLFDDILLCQLIVAVATRLGNGRDGCKYKLPCLLWFDSCLHRELSLWLQVERVG